MTIEVNDISKSAGGVDVISHLNWEISSDDFWALTGPAGSGKTLLLRILLGLDKPDSGQVRLLGDYKYDRVNAGVVFQEDRLCEQYSAAENVAMVNERLSKRVASEELARIIPQSAIDVPVSTLDPVTRRKVCIVRAAAIPSDILLMDEPFRGMFNDERAEVLRYIREKAGHKGIVIAQRTQEGLEMCRNLNL